MKIDRFRERFFEGVPRFQYLETIGHGGMGIVFKAHDLDLDEVVALKVLSPDFDSEEQDLLLRFKREINLNRKIKHPNVARIHDFGASGDYPYIIMEFVPGKDLRSLIRGKTRLEPAEAVAILRQIALGSHAAHKLGIIHRDLKSQNVMVDESGAVAILDFGLARAKVSESITLDSFLVGTPQYMSPEQAMGKPADVRSDVYSIGVIAFEALTGQVPFRGDSPMAVVLKVLSEPVPDVLSTVPGLPPELVSIVLKALAKDPDERFQTAADLETELALLELRPARDRTAGDPEARGLGADLESAFDALLSKAAPPADDSTPRAPVRRPARPAPAPIAAVRAGADDKGPKTIVRSRHPIVLVVENDPAERAGTVETLRQSGCEALAAGNGQEALECLLRTPIDLVLMDATLPGMDGFDVARVIKSQPDFVSLPILLTSPKLDRSQFAFGLQSGAADVVGKPIAPSALAWRVWKILKHRGFTDPVEREAEKAALRASLFGETSVKPPTSP